MSPLYRGRIAPSPTGYLHLGHAATFLVAADRARQESGALVFRMEDLDPARSRKEYMQASLEDLCWLGIEWAEGPDVGGAYAPYSQGERREHYLQAWRQLFKRGDIYPCRCSRKDLERIASAPHEGELRPLDDEPLYPGTCRGNLLTEDQRRELLQTGPKGWNWRFRVPDGERICFHDGHYGEQSFVAGEDFGDFLVWRRDDVPAYQLACVVDDADMQITEVVRGADLLKSTARQLLLYRTLALSAPEFYHCELLTDESGRRLAKREAALSLRALREQGVSPDEIRLRVGRAFS